MIAHTFEILANEKSEISAKKTVGDRMSWGKDGGDCPPLPRCMDSSSAEVNLVKYDFAIFAGAMSAYTMLIIVYCVFWKLWIKSIWSDPSPAWACIFYFVYCVFCILLWINSIWSLTSLGLVRLKSISVPPLVQNGSVETNNISFDFALSHINNWSTFSLLV